MSEEKANQDYRYPMAESYLYAPILTGSFAQSERIPIYWGPGQLTLSYPQYDPPNPDLWRLYEHLNIPVVTRFLYDNDEDYEPDKFNDDSTPPPPPPPPSQCIGWQYPIRKSIAVRVASSAFTNPLLHSGEKYLIEFLLGTSMPIQYFTTSLVTYVDLIEVDVALVRVTEYGSAAVIYTGTVKNCPIFKFNYGRLIEWFEICVGGGRPEGGTRTFRDSIFSSTEDEASAGAPPKCKLPIMRYDPITDTYIPSGTGDFTEVIFAAQNWYGCEETPPRTPPPPPTPFPVSPPPPP